MMSANRYYYCLYVCLCLCWSLQAAAALPAAIETTNVTAAAAPAPEKQQVSSAPEITTSTTSTPILETSDRSTTTSAPPPESTTTTTTTTTAAAAATTEAAAIPQHAEASTTETISISMAKQQETNATTTTTTTTTTTSVKSPRSDRQHVLEMFHKFFTKARSHDDKKQKEFVRDGVIYRLKELGFETSFLQKSRFDFRREPAYSFNMISILPGKARRTRDEQIVLIGAHWDSATKAPGVDDNGSGSTCLLEIARLIAANKCSFNHTVMLVWFDYEEQGKFGSEFFVNEYLFPYELEKYGSKFIGAYVLDMTLVRDKEINTQTIPLNLKAKLKDFSEEIEREKFRGDFLATWARKSWDEPLENAFRSSWTSLGYESRTFKAMRPELPQTRLPNGSEHYDWKDFFRSDHASFWYPPLTSTPVRRAPNRTSTSGHSSLNAVLLTDLGPWRKSYQKCYHSACDDEHFLTDDNLAFMQQVIDTLVLTLLRVGEGECPSTAATHKQTTTTTTTQLCAASHGISHGGGDISANNNNQTTARGCTSSNHAH